MASGPASTEALQRVRDVIDKHMRPLTNNLKGFMETAPDLLERYTEHYEVVKTMNSQRVHQYLPAPDGDKEAATAKEKPKTMTRTTSTSPFTPLLARRPTEKQLKKSDSNANVASGLAAGDSAAISGIGPQGSMGDFPKCVSKAWDVTGLELPPVKDNAVEEMRRSLPPFPEDQELFQQLAVLAKECYELRVVLQGIDDWLSLQEPSVKKQQDAEFSVAIEIQRNVRGQILHSHKEIGHYYHYLNGLVSNRAAIAKEYYEQPHAAPYWAARMESMFNEEWDDLEKAWRGMIRHTVMCMKELAANHEQLSKPTDSNVMAMAFM